MLQAYARGLGMEFVEKINTFALEGFLPDVTVFFDLSPKEAFARKKGADEDDRMELAGLAFHERVYEGYLDLAKKYPNRFVVINARKSIEEIASEVLTVLKEKGCI